MKSYNNEKCIISLTTWKERIQNVYLTLNSLIQQGKNFHIVLVLSEEEFPNKEKELPNTLLQLLEKIEIIWVYENTFSFKKILPTMIKYKNVPIISADDDCVYNNNYAEEMYKLWFNNKDKCVTYWYHGIKKYNLIVLYGAGTLYPPSFFDDNTYNLAKMISSFTKQDDIFLAIIRQKLNKHNNYIWNKNKNIFEFNENSKIFPLNKYYSFDFDEKINKIIDVVYKDV